MFKWLKNWDFLPQKGGNFFYALKDLLGFAPKNLSLYQLAFTHSSASYEQQGMRYNNQRLEFLGDAIIGAIVAEYVYKRFPERDEGWLTQIRSAVVQRKQLNHLGQKLGIGHFILTENIEKKQAKSLYGDTLEALVGAVFIDRGYPHAQKFVVERVLSMIPEMDQLGHNARGYKSTLIEWSQKNRQHLRFITTGVYGESHDRSYEISLTLNGEVICKGTGSSKKQAEEQAAAEGYPIIMKD